METCPPKLIEGVVGRLLPPARREDVIGDLRERYTSRGAYVNLGPSWLHLRPVLVRGVLGGFLMLVRVRIAWEVLFRVGGYRHITMHAIQRETVTADACRRALERRRDTLRRSWLWYLAFLVPVQVLSALPRSLDYARIWSTVFEATMTFVAVLLMRKLASRMADMLQHEIDAFETP